MTNSELTKHYIVHLFPGKLGLIMTFLDVSPCSFTCLPITKQQCFLEATGALRHRLWQRRRKNPLG